MELLKRTLRVLAVFVLANLGLLELLCPLPGTVHWLLLLGLSAFYVWFHICPRRAKGAPRRLRAMIGGYELLLVSFLTLAAETVFYIVLLCTGMPLVPAPYSAPRWVALVANLLVFLPLVGALLVNGFFRVAFTSKHLRVVWRVLLLFLWWLPFFNIYLFSRVLKTVRREYYFERARQGAEAAHIESEDCKTRYPIVLVHGIFFRAWQLFGYWGRIPDALRRCGAQIYYGGQQSALPVAQSGEELARRLRDVLRETGAAAGQSQSWGLRRRWPRLPPSTRRTAGVCLPSTC